MKYRKSRHQIKMTRIKKILEEWNAKLKNSNENLLIKKIDLINNKIQVKIDYDHLFNKFIPIPILKNIKTNYSTGLLQNHYNEKNFIYDISRMITNIYNIAFEELKQTIFSIKENIDIWDKLSKEIEDVIKSDRALVFTSLNMIKTLKKPDKFKVLIDQKTRCIYIYDIKTKAKVYNLRLSKDYRNFEIIESLYFRYKGLYYEVCPYSEYEYNYQDKNKPDDMFIFMPKYIGLSCVIYEKQLETNGLFQIKHVYPENDLVAKLKRK